MPNVHIQTKIRELLDATAEHSRLKALQPTSPELKGFGAALGKARTRVTKAERAVWQYMCRNSEDVVLVTQNSVYPERGSMPYVFIVVTRSGPTIPPAGKITVTTRVPVKRTPARRMMPF